MTEQEKEQFWKDFKKDFIAGSASGAAVTLATQPLDTIAVRAQAGTGGSKSVYRKLDKIKSQAKKQKITGIRGVYKGVTPRLLKSTAAGAIGYPVFMAAAKELEERNNEKKASLLPITTTPNAAKILPKFYHSANPGEFGRSRSMRTSEAIDYLTKSWTHRPINIGKGKEYYGPTKVASIAGILNIGVKAFKGLKNLPKSIGNNMPDFVRGATFTGTQNAGIFKSLKKPSYAAGATGSVGIGFAAPRIKKSPLELGTTDTKRRLRSNMLSPKNV